MKQNKPLLIVISLLAAIGLWIYVVTVVNPVGEVTIDNIPVSFAGAEVLREDHDLLITGDYTDFVSVHFAGKNSDLKRLEQLSEEIKAVVDVTNLRSIKVYNRSYTISLPTSLQDADIQVQERKPSSISFSLEQQISRSIPVQCDLTEVMVSEGFMQESTECDVEAVVVEGPQSVVDTIDQAQVTVRRSNVDRTIKEDLPYVLMDAVGEAVDTTDLEMLVETVEVTMNIVMYKDVPLDVTIIDGGGATGADIAKTVTPTYVTLSGDADALGGLNKIDLGTVDLSKIVTNSEMLSFPIMLPNGVKNVSGEKEAAVAVEIRNKEIAVVRVTNLSFKNVAEGFVATSITQQLQVTIRASGDDIGKITTNNVWAVADMTGYTQTGGYQLPVSIYINGFPEAGVLGDYSIAATLSKAENQ